MFVSFCCHVSKFVFLFLYSKLSHVVCILGSKTTGHDTDCGTVGFGLQRSSWLTQDCQVARSKTNVFFLLTHWRMKAKEV